MEDLMTSIKTDTGRFVFVDQFDDRVWLSISGGGGSANTQLNKDQARELIAALNRIVGGSMTNLRKAAEMALEILDMCFYDEDDKLFYLGGWHQEKFTNARKALRQALAQPEQGNNSLNYLNTESNTPFVDAVNISQERVDKTAKSEQELFFDCPRCGHCCPKSAWQQREWVELTKEDMPDGDYPMFDINEFYAGMAWAAAKLKEKNT